MATHTLILLRHAKSDWSGDEADHARPLSSRGRRQAPDAGRWLAAHVVPIDLAVVSTAERARTTWELVSAELGGTTQAQDDDEVYAAAADGLLATVRRLDDVFGTVILVGHNPGLEDLLEILTGETHPLPTSGLAVITLDGGWVDAGRRSGSLRAAGRPPSWFSPERAGLA